MNSPRKKHLTLKILLILVSIDLLETLAQFCFKKSALSFSNFQINSFLDVLNFIKTIIPSGYLWLGLIFVVLIFITWSTVLSRIDLSVAVPVCSFSYITIPLVSMIFFHESISWVRWMGIFLIIIGVILVSMSSVRRKECP